MEKEQVVEQLIYVVINQRTVYEEETFDVIYAGIDKDTAFSFEPDEHYNLVTIDVMNGKNLIERHTKELSECTFKLTKVNKK